MPIVANGLKGLTNHRDPLRIALINNMPDSVLEETEAQFMDLIHAASGDLPVQVELFSLPGISRCESVQPRMSQVYSELSSLWDSRFDAVIVTGTEPRQFDLSQEAYWTSLAGVLNWAQENTVSAILSCLAAHAAVLHNDGIAREPLAHKQCGVFSFNKTHDHEMTRGTAEVFRFPHSRWNEVPAGALNACGYTILTASADAGVDLFVKQQRKSLFVHFQGHPEYRGATLLKEYRRDINRFLKGARDTYPPSPRGYFDAPALEVLNGFREYALGYRSGLTTGITPTLEHCMAEFPGSLAALNLRNTWREDATRIYRNWLQYVAAMRGGAGQHQRIVSLTV